MLQNSMILSAIPFRVIDTKISSCWEFWIIFSKILLPSGIYCISLLHNYVFIEINYSSQHTHLVSCSDFCFLCYLLFINNILSLSDLLYLHNTCTYCSRSSGRIPSAIETVLGQTSVCANLQSRLVIVADIL